MVETPDDHVLIRAMGEPDVSSSASLRTAVNDALADGNTTVLVDLSGVTFVDSTGLGSLVTLHQSSARHGAVVALVAPSESVQHVLRLLGVDDVVPTYAAAQHALRRR